MKYYRLTIPHVSMRGNYFPRGIYHEGALPPEIIKSDKVILDREEPSEELPQNIRLVEVKKEIEKDKVELEENTETLPPTEVVSKSPKVSKTNHKPKKDTVTEVVEIEQPSLKETQDSQIKEGKVVSV